MTFPSIFCAVQDFTLWRAQWMWPPLLGSQWCFSVPCGRRTLTRGPWMCSGSGMDSRWSLVTPTRCRCLTMTTTGWLSVNSGKLSHWWGKLLKKSFSILSNSLFHRNFYYYLIITFCLQDWWGTALRHGYLSMCCLFCFRRFIIYWGTYPTRRYGSLFIVFST